MLEIGVTKTWRWVPTGRRSWFTLYSLLILGLLAAGVGLTLPHLRHFTDAAQLSVYLRSFGAWTVIAAIVLMILQTIFTPLPLFVVAGATGFIFGVLWGTLITLAGAMIGASVAFYLARWFRWGFLDQRLAGSRPQIGSYRLGELDPRHGPRLVFLARLVPVIPSSLVSYLAGLSRMPFSSFFLVSVLGNLPEIVLYTFLGYTFDNTRALNLWITVGILLVTTFYFSLVAKKHLAGFLIGPPRKN